MKQNICSKRHWYNAVCCLIYSQMQGSSPAKNWHHRCDSCVILMSSSPNYVVEVHYSIKPTKLKEKSHTVSLFTHLSNDSLLWAVVSIEEVIGLDEELAGVFLFPSCPFLSQNDWTIGAIIIFHHHVHRLCKIQPVSFNYFPFLFFKIFIIHSIKCILTMFQWVSLNTN